jgi:hypothetical protein
MKSGRRPRVLLEFEEAISAWKQEFGNLSGISEPDSCLEPPSEELLGILDEVLVLEKTADTITA